MSTTESEGFTDVGGQAELPWLSVANAALGHLGQRVSIEGELEIGRDAFVPFGVTDTRLSRRHCRLRARSDGQLDVIDLQSRNGTWLGGERITEAIVGPGQLLRIGGRAYVVGCGRPRSPAPPHPRILGVSDAIATLLADLRASVRAKGSVLLWGETGTGKGLAAEEIHLASGRSGPFVIVPGVRDDVPADAARLPDDGTLFLDGIHHANDNFSRELLRLFTVAPSLLERTVVTSCLSPEALRSKLPPELWSRLSTWSIAVPPLRARRDDIPVLLHERSGAGAQEDPLAESELVAVLAAELPGNVRELFALVDRLCAHLGRPDERAVGPEEITWTTDRTLPGDEIRVREDGSAFATKTGEWISLEARRPLRNIFAALVAQSLLKGPALSVAELVAHGWPSERMLPRSGASRVYVAVATLRKLGLGEAIQRLDSGYRLIPGHVRIERSASILGSVTVADVMLATMRRTFVWLGCLALGSFALSACGGKKTLDVEKLPCKERRPTGGPAGAYVSCSGPTKDVDVGGGMVCRAGSDIGVYNATKTVAECWVNKPVELDGVRCTNGIQLYPEGKLRRCQLDADLARKDLSIPKGSWVTFTAGGDMRRIELPKPAALGPLKCKGYMNFVYPNGKPNRCELAEPATVDGQAKKAGEVVCLDEAGKLAECSKYSFSAI